MTNYSIVKLMDNRYNIYDSDSDSFVSRNFQKLQLAEAYLKELTIPEGHKKRTKWNKMKKISYLIALFFSSLSVLILEITAIKLSLIILPNSTQSSSIIISSFLLGLSLGAIISGQIIDKTKDKIKLFVLIQLIAVYYFIFAYNYFSSSFLD